MIATLKDASPAEISRLPHIGMPSIGLGTYPLKGKKCFDTVKTALEVGYRHIDTAEMYGNESAIGDAIAASGVPRDEIFITSKVWPHNFQAPYFVASVDKSLRALNIECLDLVLLHWPRDEVPLEEPLSALQKVIKMGKVRYGGVSNFSASQMQNAIDIAGSAIACNQIKCHLGMAPSAVLALARRYDIAVTAYSPLGQGSVHADSRLNDIAEKYGCTSSQVALRWMTQQGLAVIPKASSRARLEENLAANTLQLQKDDLQLLGVL